MSLIHALQKPELFSHPVSKFEVIETHISWVLLTGTYAYKIKKPVNFGFLDFSTLEKRKHYCYEEIRLNQRLAPQLYLDVVTIRGTEQKPYINGDGPVAEYAVKMHQFPQQAQLDRVLSRQELRPEHIDQLARIVANFHLRIDIVPGDSPFGNLDHVSHPVLENFEQIRQSIKNKEIATRIEQLQLWTEEQLLTLRNIFERRKKNGFVRECHGDMHLRNMALLADEIIIFDCIEFNKNFYLIDVMSEIAFVIMDLEDRQQPTLARRFLNLYLEITGDYLGLQVLVFYKVYRALVRAKVDAIRTSQEKTGTKEYNSTYLDFLQYLQLAESYTCTNSSVLLINHGLSGSGKSTCTRKLLEKLPAIVLRSDVERKRLFNIDSQQRTSSTVDQGIYSQRASEETYSHLASLSRQLLQSGYSVIIDAANLKQAQRQLFIDLARSVNRPYIIISYHARQDTLRERITQRILKNHDASDATLEVLDHQISIVEPLGHDQLAHTITVNTEHEFDVQKTIKIITRMTGDVNKDITSQGTSD